jgi:hypothetical protein
MKQFRRTKRPERTLDLVTPRSKAQLIAMIEAGWASAVQGEVFAADQIFRELHARIDQASKLPVIHA